MCEQVWLGVRGSVSGPKWCLAIFYIEKSKLNDSEQISLFSYVSKIVERVAFIHVFNYIRENHILLPFQPGLILIDSTVHNQLVYIIYCTKH